MRGLLRAGALVVCLILGIGVGGPRAVGEAVTRVEVAEQGKPRVSGIDALEQQANELAQVITNQIRAASVEQASPKNQFFDILLLGAAVAAILAMAVKLGRKLRMASQGCLDISEPANGELDRAAEAKSFTEFAAAFHSGRPEAPLGTREFDLTADKAPEPQPTRAHTPTPMEVFLECTAKRLGSMRQLFTNLGHETNEAAQRRVLSELREENQLLRKEADLPAARPMWQMSAALDGLLQQLVERPRTVTPSTLRTVAGAIDLLHALRLQGLDPNLITTPPVRLLVADDDAISRHAVAYSLKKVFAAPDVAANGQAALALAEANQYDAMFLDIQMPGMDGFELCSRIHGTRLNATTPVVFVTCYGDFDARARSMMSGGQDLMAKPFLTFELTVKALTLVLRRRLEARAAVAPAPPAAVNTEPAVSVATTEPAVLPEPAGVV